MGVGNFPAKIKRKKKLKSNGFQKGQGDVPLERPGPSKRGICLIKASDDKKASYFLASFFTSFLFLFILANKKKRRESVEIKVRIYADISLTSSNHPPTCTQAQSALHGRCRQHQREYRSTCGGEGH